MKYVISAKRYEFAQKRAHEKGLKHNEWIYIPYTPLDDREHRLAGLHVDDEHLIGYFTDAERARLTY